MGRIIALILGLFSLAQITQCDLLRFDYKPGHILLAANDKPGVSILVDENDFEGVARAARDLALDFGRVVGVNGSIITDQETVASAGTIIVGTLGRSTIIDQLVKSRKIDVSSITGKWESYIQAVVRNPIPGVESALVIAGSDKRGVIYGIYQISETIGVSPWYWWADVPIKKKSAVYADLSSRKVQGPPSVKYRGIFINDELQLNGWVFGKFPKSPRGNYFTSEFYELVFELLLRLRANYIWPGMKRTLAFYLDDPNNPKLADSMGIVVGTSHHEPMTRAYNEQLELLKGTWDWSLNKDNVTQFMKVGAERAKDWETLWTLGMRGDGDRASPTLTASQLEEIIQVQIDLITASTKQDIKDIPLIWALYKEVGQYWQAGMNISEQVTLLFTDDNFGNLLHVPLANETSRAGGSGIYYHFGYVGSPRSYEWIDTIQLSKTWEQLHLAYERGARQVWIANVQDIKPYEVPMNHFLDMAYDMSLHTEPDSTTQWLQRWARREFDTSVEQATAQIYNTYGRLVLRRKYETLSMAPFPYPAVYYDEAATVLQEWKDLVKLAQTTLESLPASIRDTYFELVVYPVLAGENVEEIYLAKEIGKMYSLQKRTSTNVIASQVWAAWDNDAAVTARYEALFGGKWNSIPTQKHIGYTANSGPSKNILPSLYYTEDSKVPTTGILGTAVQANNQSAGLGETLRLRSVDPYMPPSEIRYFDVFTRANGTFSYEVTVNATYVSITNLKGTLSSPGNGSDVRCVISVDWTRAPTGRSFVEIRVFRTDNNATTPAILLLDVIKTTLPSSFKGFVESNKAISVEPGHYSAAETKGGVGYIEIPYYGRTSSGVKLWPVTAPSQQSPSGPKLSYDFYSYTPTTTAKLVIYLGGSLNHDPVRPLRAAWSIDSGEVTEKQVIPNYLAGTTPTDWDTAVINGGWNITSEVTVGVGAHRLNLWLLEPGIVVQKLYLDLGGVPGRTSLGPPESLIVR